MTSPSVKPLRIRLVMVGLALFAAGAAASPQGQSQATRAVPHPETSKSSAGKSETITGTLIGVDPIKGLVFIARRGPHEPPSLQLSWTERSDGAGHVERSPMTVSQGPGETDYDFRVTSSTLIEVNGARASLESLARLANAKTTVRFTVRHDGDFALEIIVGR